MTFISIEDETGIANLIVWSSRFEAQRRLVPSSSMIAGLVRREGDVIHVVARRLEDLSSLLRCLGDREDLFRYNMAAATVPRTQRALIHASDALRRASG